MFYRNKYQSETEIYMYDFHKARYGISMRTHVQTRRIQIYGTDPDNFLWIMNKDMYYRLI